MKKNHLRKIFSVIIGALGIVVLVIAILPIAQYEAESKQKYPKLISPTVEEDKVKVTFEDLDYTRASNWFKGGARKEDFIIPRDLYYKLSVPSLGIEDAKVSVGGEDLSESLIQYPGTALPGKIGNTVIFGHSILPYFFDPKDYLSIFSTLPRLKKGDEVYVNFDGIIYKYLVEALIETAPTNIQILEQDSSDSYLSLVTCVPPGHPLKPKRLIVRARIVPVNGESDSLRQANESIRN